MRIGIENYADSKKRIEEISRKYGCKGDVIMRTAIQYIVEYGQDTLSDKDFIDKQIASVIKKHDEAEAKGWILFCARDFEIAILECAAALAEIDTYNLIIYMQKEMYWSNDGGIDYKRLVDIAETLAERIVDDYWDERKYILTDELGIDEDELKYLGFCFTEDEE